MSDTVWGLMFLATVLPLLVISTVGMLALTHREYVRGFDDGLAAGTRMAANRQRIMERIAEE